MTTSKKPAQGKKAEEPRIAPLFGTPGIGKNAIIERATMEQNLRDKDKEIQKMRAEATDRHARLEKADKDLNELIQRSQAKSEEIQRLKDALVKAREERDILKSIVNDAGITDIRTGNINGRTSIAYTPPEPATNLPYGQGALPGDKHLNSYGRPSEATMVQRAADAKVKALSGQMRHDALEDLYNATLRLKALGEEAELLEREFRRARGTIINQ